MTKLFKKPLYNTIDWQPSLYIIYFFYCFLVTSNISLQIFIANVQNVYILAHYFVFTYKVVYFDFFAFLRIVVDSQVKN